MPPGVILAIACVANFMVIIDTSIVNVALPAMKAALGLSAADQQWVVDGYLITFGGFLLVAARAGDLFGRKGVFQAGLLVFTAASLAGGLAQDPWLLIAARVLQGIGAAALASSSLSLITASHPEGPARTHALSLWAAVGSSAGAVGVVLGGLLTTELSWRYVLYINVPIGVALLTAAAASLVPSPARRDWARLDLPGALTVTVGAGSAVYAVSQATIKGWGSTPVIAALAAAAILLAAFGMIEARSAAPLVPLSIFGQRSLAVGNTVMACLGVVMTSGFFFLSLYLQQILGYSALRTGAAIVPMTVLLAAGPLAAKRLLPRFGPRFLILAGGILTTTGVAWMSLLPNQSDYAARILGPMLVIGAGIGLVLLPLAASATAGIEARLRRARLGPVQHGAPARRRHRPRRARHHRRLRHPPQPSRQPRCRHCPRLPHRPAHLRGRQPGLGPHCPPPAHPGQEHPGNPHRAPSAHCRRKEMTTKHNDQSSQFG